MFKRHVDQTTNRTNAAGDVKKCMQRNGKAQQSRIMCIYQSIATQQLFGDPQTKETTGVHGNAPNGVRTGGGVGTQLKQRDTKNGGHGDDVGDDEKGKPISKVDESGQATQSRQARCGDGTVPSFRGVVHGVAQANP